MARKNSKSAKTANGKTLCGCGCGDSPKGKRSRFIPGHDARLHSLRLKVERGEVKAAKLSKAERTALAA